MQNSNIGVCFQRSQGQCVLCSFMCWCVRLISSVVKTHLCLMHSLNPGGVFFSFLFFFPWCRVDPLLGVLERSKVSTWTWLEVRWRQHHWELVRPSTPPTSVSFKGPIPAPILSAPLPHKDNSTSVKPPLVYPLVTHGY